MAAMAEKFIAGQCGAYNPGGRLQSGNENKKNKDNENDGRSSEVVFDLNLYAAAEGGSINSTVIADAVVALIKYCLYQRGQTPSMFDDMFNAMAASVGAGVVFENTMSLAGARRRQQEKRTKTFIETFVKLFAHLRNLLTDEKRIWIRRVALILGSTPVTPKEVHCIEFVQPRQSTSTNAATSDSHVRSMFKRLVSSSKDLHFPRCLSRTNVTVMIEASATSELTWFVPKSYSPLPGPSSRHRIHFTYRLSPTSSSVAYSDSDLRTTVTSAPIINERLQSRPFTVYESPVTTKPLILIQAPIETFEDGDEPPLVQRSVPEETFVWFQMPVVVRGLNVRN